MGRGGTREGPARHPRRPAHTCGYNDASHFPKIHFQLQLRSSWCGYLVAVLLPYFEPFVVKSFS